MEAFAQGFFGRNSELQYNLELEIESAGVNSTEGAAVSVMSNDQLHSVPKRRRM